MVSESQLEHLEHLIDAYAAIKVYFGREEELESKIEYSFTEMASRDADFHSIVSILGRGLDHTRLLPSRVAWVLQHALGCRAYCVKNHIVQRRDSQRRRSYESPMLDQSKISNLMPNTIDLESIYNRRESMKCRKTLDALLVNSDNATIYPVMAIPLSSIQARQVGSSRKASEPRLFAPQDRELLETSIDGRAAAGLLLARDLLSEALPNLHICPLAVIMDDTDGSWGFQAHELKGDADTLSNERNIELDDFGIVCSSLEWRRNGKDMDLFATVPEWGSKDRLYNLPIDRATRCHMTLRMMWDAQIRSPDTLIGKSWNDLGEAAQEHFNFIYTTDLRRHDCEDCLERSGYLQRLTHSRSMFAITPRGVARIMLAQRLLAPVTPADIDNGVAMGIITMLYRQAQCWSRYRDGIAS